jgi:hypothetical protein
MTHTKYSADKVPSAVCCPYFKRLTNITAYPILGYCERPSAGLQVPALGELRLFCLNCNYRQCTGHQSAAEAAGFPEPQPLGE